MVLITIWPVQKSENAVHFDRPQGFRDKANFTGKEASRRDRCWGIKILGFFCPAGIYGMYAYSICRYTIMITYFAFSGRDYDHGHFTRAVCCRVYDILQESLPPGFRINHPVLSTPNFPFTVGGNNHTSLCLNWSLGDEKVEIVNGFSGRTDKS